VEEIGALDVAGNHPTERPDGAISRGGTATLADSSSMREASQGMTLSAATQ